MVNPISIVEFKLGKCCGCEGDLDPDSDPHYIDTPKGRLWYCAACVDGIIKLLDALDFPYEKVTKDGV